MRIFSLALPILLTAILLFTLYAIALYNRLIQLRNSLDEAYATMDVYLKKRWDLIPNIIESVKGYAKHEKETLEQVISARNSALQADSLPSRAEGDKALTNSLKSLFALAESYPDLKADRQFLNLQEQLQKVEEDIAQSRKYYNAVAKTLNTKGQEFPAVLFAKGMGFEQAPYFQVNKDERGTVEVKF